MLELISCRPVSADKALKSGFKIAETLAPVTLDRHRWTAIQEDDRKSK